MLSVKAREAADTIFQVFAREAADTIFQVFGMTQLRIKPRLPCFADERSRRFLLLLQSINGSSNVDKRNPLDRKVIATS